METFVPHNSKMSSGHSLGVGRYYNSHAVMVVNGSNVTCGDSLSWLIKSAICVVVLVA